MGQGTKIQWPDHTFNPWRGCTKVAAGCANCYAEALSKRNPGVLGVWGDDGTRVVASEAMWREPVKWNRMAACYCGADSRHASTCPQRVRPRVFCASLCDVFEDRDELLAPRERLFDLIDATPNLDWLLLTKRPQNIRRMWLAPCELCGGTGLDYINGQACSSHSLRRHNVWLGTSVACQDDADRNVPELLKCRDLAAKLFLSIEPLVGPVDITPWIGGRLYRCKCGYHRTEGELVFSGGDKYSCVTCGQKCAIEQGIDFVIVGGESGSNARPCDVEWIRSVVRQCQAAGVPVFVKQLGARCEITGDSFDCWPQDYRTFGSYDETLDAWFATFSDPKGGDPSEWPEDLRVREVPPSLLS